MCVLIPWLHEPKFQGNNINLVQTVDPLKASSECQYMLEFALLLFNRDLCNMIYSLLGSHYSCHIAMLLPAYRSLNSNDIIFHGLINHRFPQYHLEPKFPYYINQKSCLVVTPVGNSTQIMRMLPAVIIWWQIGIKIEGFFTQLRLGLKLKKAI